MPLFERLFGIKRQQIKRTCIISPLLPKGILDKLGIKSLSKGKIYNSAGNDYFSLIHTGVGPSFVGDAVLHLKYTDCQNVILFGSCGLVSRKKRLNIGSLVAPYKCYSNESFSEWLRGKWKSKTYLPDKQLFKEFMEANRAGGLEKTVCSTVPSLKLEEERVKLFIEKRVDVVDMECSAFFSASKYSGLRAIAFFYISDIIKGVPFYAELEPDLKSRLSLSIKKAVDLLCEFIKGNLTA